MTENDREGVEQPSTVPTAERIELLRLALDYREQVRARVLPSDSLRKLRAMHREIVTVEEYFRTSYARSALLLRLLEPLAEARGRVELYIKAIQAGVTLPAALASMKLNQRDASATPDSNDPLAAHLERLRRRRAGLTRAFIRDVLARARSRQQAIGDQDAAAARPISGAEDQTLNDEPKV